MKYIDMHCDTASKLLDENKFLLDNDFSIDINKLIKGHSMAQFFAFFIDMKNTENPFDRILKMKDVLFEEISKNKDRLSLATDYNSLIKNQDKNKISCFLTLEEGGAINGDINNLDILYDLGLRLITLTWNYENQIGYPHNIEYYKDKGLKPFGKDLIEIMNHYKMIIDVSHLSDKGFYDVAKLSKFPFVASHSNSRFIQNHSRNLSDEMIKTLANSGGVMGLNFCSSFLGNNPVSTIDDMKNHLMHIRNKGGIDVICLGTDFDGIENQVEIKDASEMDKLYLALKGTFNEDEIEKIFYKNAIRLIKDVL
ncbi:MAG: dipeptidase [Clostridiaceae bacterium]